jgi:hypothetical protein
MGVPRPTFPSAFASPSGSGKQSPSGSAGASFFCATPQSSRHGRFCRCRHRRGVPRRGPGAVAMHDHAGTRAPIGAPRRAFPGQRRWACAHRGAAEAGGVVPPRDLGVSLAGARAPGTPRPTPCAGSCGPGADSVPNRADLGQPRPATAAPGPRWAAAGRRGNRSVRRQRRRMSRKKGVPTAASCERR